MSFVEYALLFLSAALGGALNAVAGGGSFIAFPALLFAGVPPIQANATNTVALWPAGLTSAFAYRREMSQSRRSLVILSIASLVGGVGGALLLLVTRDSTFVRLLPFLLLFATMVFTFGGRITARLRRAREAPGHEPGTPASEPGTATAGAFVAQLAIAIYGGYFGGGMGILMLATLALMGMSEIHAMNAFKVVLGVFINGVAVAIFVAAGKVVWGPGVVMIAGAALGGFLGAHVARRLEPALVKRFVLVVAWAMTGYFFVHTYMPVAG